VEGEEGWNDELREEVREGGKEGMKEGNKEKRKQEGGGGRRRGGGGPDFEGRVPTLRRWAAGLATPKGGDPEGRKEYEGCEGKNMKERNEHTCNGRKKVRNMQEGIKERRILRTGRKNYGKEENRKRRKEGRNVPQYSFRTWCTLYIGI
jgi:hypothetical protein